LEQRSELSALVDDSPNTQANGLVRWRRIDLKLIINKRFGVDFCEQHVGTLLKKLGLSLVCTTPAACRSNCSLQNNFPQTLGTHLSEFPEQTPVET
jgi:transposase